MICSTCRSFKRGVYPRIDLRAKHAYHNLLKTSESCECCRILVQGCRGLLDKLGKRSEDVITCELWFRFDIDADSNQRDCQKLIILNFANEEPLTIACCAFIDEEGWTEIPSSWDNFPSANSSSVFTGSDKAFDQINTWIRQCTTEHDFCSNITDQQLPTRLVDVGLDGGKVKLIETHGAKGRYITLSHCWGKQQIITTKIATLEERKQGIEESDLSKTFHQAIELTRRLQVAYIWIDSLCIIQDDKDDWAREASEMAALYQRAALTIAATSSSSGSGGLFRTSPEYLLSGVTSENEAYELIFRKCIEHETMDAHQDNLSREFPLMTRAWILQERLLSPRVLHFGPYELFFECRSGSECECGEIYGFEMANPMPKLMLEEALTKSDNAWFVGRAWRGLVGLYTGLSITHLSDCLPALGGLAKRMSEIRSGGYVAGLWEDSINDDLLWQPTRASKIRPEWRAPTWSWASVVNPIHYSDAPLFWNEDESEEERESVQHFAVITNIQCTSKFDRFGELRSGELHIKSRRQKANLLYWDKGKQDTQFEKWTRLSINPRDVTYAVNFPNGVGYEISPDYSLDKASGNFLPSGTEVLCLLMSIVPHHTYQTANETKSILYALVAFQPDSTKQIYERIALLEVNEKLGHDIDACLELFPEKTSDVILH